MINDKEQLDMENEIVALLKSHANPVQAAEFALDLLKSFQALSPKERAALADLLATSS